MNLVHTKKTGEPISLVETRLAEEPEERSPAKAKLAYGMHEAAALISVSYHTLFRLIKKGEIKSVRKTRTHLIPRKELERFIEDSAI